MKRLLRVLLSAVAVAAQDCKCLPGDSCWPSISQWEALNSTVGGRLVATVPLGSPCHDPDYDSEKCDYLQSQWQYAGIHMDDSSSVMAPFFANQSCDPFQPQSRTCELGNYVVYSVRAESASDVQAAIAFAQEHSIRFVIRNTGHDYNGRSTGAGALSVWTHYMKDIEILGRADGKALKVGAGVQGFEAVDAAHKAGLVVVGGECPTVGLAGGYTQGGGHSALSTSFGLSADNVLEWEVVTAAGELALGGGGGGNWGVVTSMTVKAHADAACSGASVVIMAAENEETAFYKAIDAFHEELADMVDAGALVIYYFSADFFQIAPLTAYDQTEADVRAMLSPFINRLKRLGITYTEIYSESPDHRTHFDQYFGPLPLGNIQVGIAQYGGRLIPRDSINNITSFTRLIGATPGAIFIGVGTDVSPFAAGQSNSVLPAWRDALVHATLTTPWDFEASWEDMIANQVLMTNELMPAIEALTPGSGAYMNEADFRQPNFQREFFGSSYRQLSCIKSKWDPEGFFYALNGVGSEKWTVSIDGRMCRASDDMDL
ncbi:FAD binding domain-containing protein [Emericellopsis atlantica]|uniref:FAD binding domain-containing protein n=1 Tax=Emericellopsis atlantica TaxID=2614577 RepID=A0A9P7ZRK2_9HYPO|nr:FAD binding domain-containing protein [Emericellopsis atlantica]KAG9256537.1 FAD binding domain-containing protein [Emericellopsis atlantica]